MNRPEDFIWEATKWAIYEQDQANEAKIKAIGCFYGWPARNTLKQAVQEMVDAGWVVVKDINDIETRLELRSNDDREDTSKLAISDSTETTCSEPSA
jgi:hypothetical protein